MDKQDKQVCRQCSQAIRFAADLWVVEKGVLSAQVVPLGDVLLFCSERCVSRYFDGVPSGDLPELPRRVP